MKCISKLLCIILSTTIFFTGCGLSNNNMEKEYGLSYVSKGKQTLIAPAVEYIHKNYTSSHISVEELSKSCGITPEYFRSIFKNHFGTSPLKYINNLKLDKAKHLLKYSKMKIYAIAEECGFSSCAYFCAVFGKECGMTPDEYRRI